MSTSQSSYSPSPSHSHSSLVSSISSIHRASKCTPPRYISVKSTPTPHDAATHALMDSSSKHTPLIEKECSQSHVTSVSSSSPCPPVVAPRLPLVLSPSCSPLSHSRLEPPAQHQAQSSTSHNTSTNASNISAFYSQYHIIRNNAQPHHSTPSPRDNSMEDEDAADDDDDDDDDNEEEDDDEHDQGDGSLEDHDDTSSDTADSDDMCSDENFNLYELLEQQRAAQALQPSSACDSDELKYVRFINWMKEGGAKFPHLILKHYSKDYRGVHISMTGNSSKSIEPAAASVPASHDEEKQLQLIKPINNASNASANDSSTSTISTSSPPKSTISKGRVLLRVPHSLLITVELAKCSPIGQVVSTLPNLGSQAILAVYLIQEIKKGTQSFWYPWLQVLPQSFDNLPMFFNTRLLAQLKGCHDLLLKIQSQQKSMKEEYLSIKQLPGINSFPSFTYMEFIWAALAVGTRVFSLCINNQKTSVLAPLADMMNHRNPAGTNWTYDSKRQGFTLTACQTLNDGDAVYESYGIKDNKRFFASYGFVLDENSANEVTICIRGDLAIDSNTVRHFTVRGGYDQYTEELLNFLRIANTYEYHLNEFDFHTSTGLPHLPYPPRSPFPISLDNELSSLYALRLAANEHLKMYETTLQQDMQLLADIDKNGANDTESYNLRNCIVFRMGEKKIYQFYVDFCTLNINLLCLPWDEAKNAIREIIETGKIHHVPMARLHHECAANEAEEFKHPLVHSSTPSTSSVSTPSLLEQDISSTAGPFQHSDAASSFMVGTMAYITGIIVPLLQERHREILKSNSQFHHFQKALYSLPSDHGSIKNPFARLPFPFDCEPPSCGDYDVDMESGTSSNYDCDDHSQYRALTQHEQDVQSALYAYYAHADGEGHAADTDEPDHDQHAEESNASNQEAHHSALLSNSSQLHYPSLHSIGVSAYAPSAPNSFYDQPPSRSSYSSDRSSLHYVEPDRNTASLDYSSGPRGAHDRSASASQSRSKLYQSYCSRENSKTQNQEEDSIMRDLDEEEEEHDLNQDENDEDDDNEHDVEPSVINSAVPKLPSTAPDQVVAQSNPAKSDASTAHTHSLHLVPTPPSTNAPILPFHHSYTSTPLSSTSDHPSSASGGVSSASRTYHFSSMTSSATPASNQANKSVKIKSYNPLHPLATTSPRISDNYNTNKDSHVVYTPSKSSSAHKPSSTKHTSTAPSHSYSPPVSSSMHSHTYHLYDSSVYSSDRLPSVSPTKSNPYHITPFRLYSAESPPHASAQTPPRLPAVHSSPQRHQQDHYSSPYSYTGSIHASTTNTTFLPSLATPPKTRQSHASPHSAHPPHINHTSHHSNATRSFSGPDSSLPSFSSHHAVSPPSQYATNHSSYSMVSAHNLSKLSPQHTDSSPNEKKSKQNKKLLKHHESHNSSYDSSSLSSTYVPPSSTSSSSVTPSSSHLLSHTSPARLVVPSTLNSSLYAHRNTKSPPHLINTDLFTR